MNALISEIFCVAKHAAHCKRVRPTRAGVGVYGLPSLATMGTGAAIGSTVSASVQYTIKGKVEVADTFYGGLTGAFTMGQSIIPSLVIKTGGAISSAAFSGDPATSSAAGATAGTFAGTGFSTTLDFISNSNAFGKYSQPVQQGTKLFKPVASSFMQEIVGTTVKDTIEK